MTILKVDDQLRSLIPPLDNEERAQLEANLLEEGCRDPIVVWNDTIVDGHNRYEICTKNNIPFRTTSLEFESKAHVRVWMRKNQAGRRNLTPAWKIELALGNKDDLLAIGREKHAATAGRQTVSQNDSVLDSSRHSTRAEVAKTAGVSTGSVGMAEQIRKKAPELWDKAKTGDIAISAAYKEVQKRDKHERKTASHTETVKATLTTPAVIEHANALDWLAEQEAADLLLTDPPYMTDVPDIQAFAESWLPLALNKVKRGGRAYICVGAYPEELNAYMTVRMPTQILVWTYRNTLGPNTKTRYKQNWQAILYYAAPDAPSLNGDNLIEKLSVQDINAPDGRLGDRYHAWQKPLDLAERFIRHATVEGATVLDPFACTGTFLLAASRLGRIGRGCELNEEHLDIAVNRGCQRA